MTDSDTSEFICQDSCDTKYYLDTLTYENISLCVPSCRNLVPEAYVHVPKDENYNQCTRSAPNATHIYLVPKSDTNELTFSDKCDDTYPYSDGLTITGLHICVKSCNNLNPPAFVHKTGEISECFRDCSTSTTDPKKLYIDPITNVAHP